MHWLRLSLTTRAEYIEPVTDLLQRFEAASVSIAPAGDEGKYACGTEMPGYWKQSSISALLHPDIDMDIVLASLRNLVGTENLVHHRLEKVVDKNWVASYHAQHGPLVIADTLCICPGWEHPPSAGLQTVYLDPGLAFGTGSHPTTRLCLEWLVHNTVQGRVVTDFGCGSGILALAAARLGAAAVHAVDIDPQALAACRDNAAKNGLDNKITVHAADSFRTQGCDMLLANILCKPLLQLGQCFADTVTPGGQLVLSGLLATQAGECSDCYTRWFDMQAPVFAAEWALLTGYRKQI